MGNSISYGMGYTIEIRNGSKSSYKYRRELQKVGFIWDGGCWKKEGAQDAAHWENWCLLRGLRMKAIGKESERGSNYRKIFFEYYKPMWGDKYNCAYCGRRLTRKQVQVDHIISVELAKRRADVRKKIKKYGWVDINDPENLCAACSVCNRLKSWKGGLWIVRGRLGKKKWFQMCLAFLKVVLLILTAAFLVFAVYVFMVHMCNIGIS